MIKTFLALPFFIAFAMLIGLWFVVAIVALIGLSFLLSPLLACMDKLFNLTTPSKYSDYGRN